ncbi:hypothetical protein TorRG33x02_264220 [Trema orientale]|uniref:Transmembrane protein n=1 Tax=Trema orientale TaxID=63057 RepID=A0A2P5D2X0_TREOI|nr:hypothetical protein TorRG33x02_264220 [Trema orientale]
MAWDERPKPIICKPGSPAVAAGEEESWPCWSFWVSWKTMEEVPESIEDLDLMSTMLLLLLLLLSVVVVDDQPKLPKLFRAEEEGDVPASNLDVDRDESHQLPLVWNSSAMARASYKASTIHLLIYMCV